MSATYHFVSTFRVVGDPERVWNVLSDVAGWARWWPELERVEVVAGPAGAAQVGSVQVGAVHRHTIRTPLGYRLAYDIEITALDRMRSVDAAVRGDLAGRGRAAVGAASDDEATIWFAWLVETTKPWMRVMSPVARPVFTWAHHRLMADFGAGFAAAAGARLLSVEHLEIRPGEPGFLVMPEVLA
ncbi:MULTISPECIES: SRPBCC family protein [unclassified Microbacterium]|uniref:SRPBCC family protein n=1 Tax=unclassified Microbacterium TaxID=2609290 RepID=UPI0012F8B9F9|nr:SRPBCC family protein [Microbacterium sp. MAH-37]